MDELQIILSGEPAFATIKQKISIYCKPYNGL